MLRVFSCTCSQFGCVSLFLTCAVRSAAEDLPASLGPEIAAQQNTAIRMVGVFAPGLKGPQDLPGIVTFVGVEAGSTLQLLWDSDLVGMPPPVKLATHALFTITAQLYNKNRLPLAPASGFIGDGVLDSFVVIGSCAKWSLDDGSIEA